SKFQTGLDKIEDKIMNKDPTQSAYYAMGSKLVADNSAIVQEVVSAVATTVNIKAIEDGIKSFAESSQVLMKALDAVSQVHPAVGVVVLAFKAVVTLELKRRSNDHKVIVIQLKMKDMVSVLLDLRSIKDPRQKARDGTTLEGRIQDLMGRIAKDIDECGNTCQAYTAKHTLVKIIKSISWEGKLSGYADLFDQHRKDIAFAINVHTTLGVESANVKLEGLIESARTIEEGVNMLSLFRLLDSPREKEIMELVRANGGAKECMENDAVLKKLAAAKASHVTDSKGFVDPVKLGEIRKDLKEDIEDALKNNYALFEKKMALQRQDFVDDVDKSVVRESDRVISALKSGPHDRVVDKDLHDIWKEMGWKSSVKARHFVLAVHDHFIQKFGDNTAQDHLETHSDNGGGTEISFVTGKAGDEDDSWTLQYINLVRVPAILEAFDDDGSGFINVVEVNDFTSSRPKDWSLLHWIAYWAEGWHYTIWGYRNKILSILSEMYGVVDKKNVHPANRSVIDLYLSSPTLEQVERLTKSVTPYTEQNIAILEEKFRVYANEREERLKNKLETVDWNIDGLDTLSLITGRGRIEQNLFPLLYLVLRRHLSILRLASEDTLDPTVLEVPAESISTIMDAVSLRMKHLLAVLKMRGSDTSALLGNVAFGMFKLLNDPTLAKDEVLAEDEAEEVILPDISEEETKAELESINKNGSVFTFLTDPDGYEEVDKLEFDEDAGSEEHGSLHGVWTGHCSYDEDGHTDGLMQINIAHLEGNTFEGTGMDRVDSFSIDGEITTTTANGHELTFKMGYHSLREEGTEFGFEFKGTFDTSTLEVKGVWGALDDDAIGTFLITRRPAFARRFLYNQQEFSKNRAHARWRFALDTVRHQVRQQLWSKSYFEERMVMKKRYIHLRVRADIEKLYSVNPANQLTASDVIEMKRIERVLLPPDGRYYESLAMLATQMLCIHRKIYCDGCYASIIGSRLICLDCMTADLSNEIDMCELCIDNTASNDSFKHHPSHDSLLVFRTLHNRKKKATIEIAKEFITAGKEVLGDSDNEVECVSCGCPVEMPCWLCIDTECEGAFICAACQSKKDPTYTKNSHTATHPLVRLSHPVASKKNTVEGTIDSLHSRFTEDMADVRTRIGTLEETIKSYEVAVNKRLGEIIGSYEAMVDQRITTLEDKVEQRLLKMEELLLRVLSGAPAAQSSV
ncbi:hypothetical protein FRC19_001553, partial [Serendipita sp. 401]